MMQFPLLSKSALLQRLVALPSDEDDDEIRIPDIPGGPVAFEICAKFCYGMAVTLNAYNVVAARCAAQYLEMHETVEKGNLIYKIDVFLSSSVFRGWKDSIIVLQTAKSSLPWSEDLKLISHCTDSLASKICMDTSKVEWSYSYNRGRLPSEKGHEQDWNGVRKPQPVPKDWWVEDLCDLDMDSFKRVITAVKSKGRISGDVIGEALKAYTYRRVAGFGKGAVHSGSVLKNRSLVETIVWMLPSEKASISCSFQFKLLRAARLLDCGEMCRKELVKRVGRQLEEASVSDLLMLREQEDDRVYDVDLVLNVVEEFLMQQDEGVPSCPSSTEELRETTKTESASRAPTLSVAKLLDGYLAEVARDPKLSLSKFIDLAEMISGNSRPVHDGLYRAVDMYLKVNPKRRRLAPVIPCTILLWMTLFPSHSLSLSRSIRV